MKKKYSKNILNYIVVIQAIKYVTSGKKDICLNYDNVLS